jgi:diguanylate cyclase (GGDEF)-like protein
MDMRDKGVRELEYLSEIVESIFSTVELQRVLNVIARKATTVLDADASAILLVEPGSNEMRIRASHNLSPEYVEVVKLRVGEELSGKVVADGEPVYISDAINYFTKKKDKFSLKWIKKERLVSAISLPISSRMGNRGTINIYYRKSHDFTDEEKRIIALFASFSSVAISNATSFEERRREILALEALNLIGQKISSISDFSSLVEVVYGETSKIMKTENFYLALYDPKENEIGFTLYVEEGKRRARSKRKLRRGLTEFVIRTQKPLLMPNNVVEEAKKLGIEALGRSAQCWMGVPILYGKKVLGVIAVQDYKKPNVYDESDMKVLQTIANQTAVAIENSLLYEETRKMAVTDPMTGLHNIRHLYNVLQLEIERAKRYGQRFSLLIIDIDNFKAYNDKYGHLLGDELLISYGQFLLGNSRKVDTVCRYGGDEFVIVLPETGLDDVRNVSSRIIHKLKRHRFKIKDRKISLMVTIGEASFPEDGNASEELIRTADRNLLEKKRAKEKKKP